MALSDILPPGQEQVHKMLVEYEFYMHLTNDQCYFYSRDKL